MDFRKTVMTPAFAIIQSYNGTSPKASTVTPTTERTAFRDSSLLIRTCKPVTCIRGRDSSAQTKATPEAARLAPVVGKNHSLTRNGISASQLGSWRVGIDETSTCTSYAGPSRRFLTTCPVHINSKGG